MVSSPSGLLTFFVSSSARNRTSPLMLARLAALLALTVLCVPAGWSAGPTIVVVGDSLSSGYGYEVVNASIAGDTSAGGLARLPRLLDAHSPDIVVLELGGNDGLRGQPV